MSKYYQLSNLANWSSHDVFGKARGNQQTQKLQDNFDENSLLYLSEKVINHLADSVRVEALNIENLGNSFNDYSFLTAPAYKAFEGFLFQIAEDLKLPSGNSKFVGTFFDEEKVDQTIDKLLKELEEKSDTATKLNKEEKVYIKDMVKEMKRFLHHYRHTPAHFHGDLIDTPQKAAQNIHSIYRIINETIKILLGTGLIELKDEVF